MGIRGVRSLIFSTTTPLMYFKTWLPAPCITPDYKKINNSCSCLTPVTNRVECEQTLISQKHYDKKSLLVLPRFLYQTKISIPGLLQFLLKNVNSYRSRLLYSGSCTPLMDFRNRSRTRSGVDMFDWNRIRGRTRSDF